VEVRMDSLTGPVIGETETIRAKGEMVPDRLRVALPTTNGVHDLYFVFRNEGAASGRPLFYAIRVAVEGAER
ncbi:MAG TPA: hypothetical protein VFV33_00710, partial [Gemmatimonadaceae bacterium]|nr:hypothetical protein [Gemmatimonadaceae bacterium]